MAEKNFIFGTKSENLYQLKEKLDYSKIPKFIYFNIREWKNNKDTIIFNIINKFIKNKIVVRSSGKDEDGNKYSLAGKFLSLLNVKTTKNNIINAVNKVINSYDTSNIFNQVIVQQQVEEVLISGVIFTRDINNGSQYYSITYDDFSGLTNTVTSGLRAKSLIIYNESYKKLKSNRFRNLIKAIKEIEIQTNSNFLDIEFCIDKRENIFILQVRPLIIKNISSERNQIFKKIKLIKNKLYKDSINKKKKLGKYSIYSDMADWNPSEMIGNFPKILSQDLYNSLITKNNWSKSREFLGYKFINSNLMTIIENKPYIDLRLSLSSLLPERLEKKIANKIINIQLELINQNSRLHNKIESEVCIPSLDLNFDYKIKKYKNLGLTNYEIKIFKKRLKDLTISILFDKNKSIESIFNKTKNLASNKNNFNSDSLFIKDLLRRCNKFGTYPFSIIARHAFIGSELLKSLLSKKLIKIKDYENFYSSIETVTSNTLRQFKNIKNSKDEKKFLNEFGHLRPGTYDIMSKRYDEGKGIYFNSLNTKIKIKKNFKLTISQQKKINNELIKIGLKNFKSQDLFNYIKMGIVFREKTKFEFSKNISEFLKYTKKIGIRKGFKRDELSFLYIKEILKIENLKNNQIVKLKNLIQKRKKNFKKSKIVKLPDVIINSSDIEILRVPINKPTFITNKIIKGETYILNKFLNHKLDNLIILIDFADPGYDWIFMHNIRGLITKFGNPNSHMSIRCAELDIPAAIGCGQRLYDFLKENRIVEINCYDEKINCLN